MTKETIQGFDWRNATDEQIDLVAPILLKGFDPEFFNKAGLRKAISMRAGKRAPEEIIADFKAKSAKAKESILSEIDPAILELDVDTLQDILERTGSKINILERYTEATMHKAYSLLSNRLKKKEVTLEEARLLEKPLTGTGTRWSVQELDLDDRSNNGIPENVAVFINNLRQLDPDIKYGRNTGKRPMLNVMLPNEVFGSLIYITLPKEFVLDEEPETGEAG